MHYYSEFGPGPGLLPLWTSGFIIFLAIANIVKSVKLNKDSTSLAKIFPKGTGLVNLLACVVGLALYITIVKYIGFTISGILMLTILFSRGYKWYWALGLSILVTGILFWLFVLTLGVPLPLNSFGW